jgi:hypothetical protein
MSGPSSIGSNTPTFGTTASAANAEVLKDAAADKINELAEADENAKEDQLAEEKGAQPAYSKRVNIKSGPDRITVAEAKKGESVLVRLENDAKEEFGGFQNRKENIFLKLPKEKFVKLAVELETLFNKESSPEDFLQHIEKSLEGADPIVVAKAFEFLTIILNKRISTEEGEDKKVLQSKLDNLNYAYEKIFMAREGVKEAIELVKQPQVLEASFHAVNIQEKTVLSIAAESLLKGIEKITVDFKTDTRPDAEQREIIDIIRYAETRVIDKSKSTVMKEFKVLSDILIKRIDEAPATEKPDLIALDKKIKLAQTEFERIHKAALQKEEDMSGAQKTILDKMREMIIKNPTKTIQDMGREIFANPNWDKEIKRITDPIFTFIGQAIMQITDITDDQANKAMFSKIRGECTLAQTFKGAIQAINKAYEAHSRYLSQRIEFETEEVKT